MRIALISNPKSGRGRAGRLAQAIVSRAIARGHEVHRHEIGNASPLSHQALHGSDLVVIVGGDGTVHHMLPMLSKTQIPFYHCGTGTANLIAHAFRMSPRPATIIEQLEKQSRPIRVDLPLCNGHPFLIMTSLGMDASIIHRLEESRTLGGYRAYFKPVMQEILRPRFANACVELDAKPSPDFSHPGVLIIANMPNYGAHFDPCPRASWNDQRLDIAHIPASYSISAGLRYLALLARLPAARCASAKHIALIANAPCPVQVDGEKPKSIPHTLASKQRLDFTFSAESVLIHAPRITHLRDALGIE